MLDRYTTGLCNNAKRYSGIYKSCYNIEADINNMAINCRFYTEKDIQFVSKLMSFSNIHQRNQSRKTINKK